MIKLTNRQAEKIVFHKSLHNKNFPIKEALLLADIIDVIKGRLDVYIKGKIKIIEKNNGIISDNGEVGYKDKESADNAFAELEELSNIVREYPGEKIKSSGAWPDLSIDEVATLKPLLSG